MGEPTRADDGAFEAYLYQGYTIQSSDQSGYEDRWFAYRERRPFRAWLRNLDGDLHTFGTPNDAVAWLRTEPGPASRTMNRYRQERDHLLHEAGSFPYPGQRPSVGQIVPSDYVAAPTIPANLFGPIAANCLIWRGGLDTGGYGVLRLDGRRELAHRAAYRQTRGLIPEGLDILHLCNRRSCVQPAHLYAGSRAANNRDRELRFGDNQKKGLPLVIQAMNHWRDRGYPIPDLEHDPEILEEGPLAEARRMFGETEQWHARAWEAADHAWDDPPEQPKQPMMAGLEPPAPTHECRFEIPAGGVKICSVCGESPNADEWRELMKMLKCHDASGGSSYVAHTPVINEWPPTSVRCARCGCSSPLGTGEQHMDVIIENDLWLDEMNVHSGAIVSAGPYTGMVRKCFGSPRTSDGSPFAWDVYVDSDDGVEVLVTNGGRFLVECYRMIVNRSDNVEHSNGG